MTVYKVEFSDDGNEFWYNEEGEYHRENGPAVTWWDGEEWYHLNGKLHRENGPAIVMVNGDEEYWINDKELTKEEFDARGNPKHEGQVVTVDGVEYELSAVTKGEQG